MLRAIDRLEEAEFFLEKLRETEGRGREFRYYLSALVSATRSIGWVGSPKGPSPGTWFPIQRVVGRKEAERAHSPFVI